MKYISGIHALNLPCSLEKCGDWHTSALIWTSVLDKRLESDNSKLGLWGIEECSVVPENNGTYMIANTLRALVDLLDFGNFAAAQGMKDDFICNDKYTDEVFEKVYLLVNNDNWGDIDKFMCKEYKLQWIKFKESKVV